MKKFLVAFKEGKLKEKKFVILSQDEATAGQWAEKQLQAWKKTMKFSITPVVS